MKQRQNGILKTLIDTSTGSDKIADVPKKSDFRYTILPVTDKNFWLI